MEAVWIMTKTYMLITVFCILVTAGSGIFGQEEKNMTGKKICLYSGSGGELAENVGFALRKLDIAYDKLNGKDIGQGELESCSVLIIPGGYTKKAVNTLEGGGFTKIREFMAKGGGYIGICAGAYLASGRVNVSGKPDGVGVADIKNVRKSDSGMRRIHLKTHQITRGLKGGLKIYRQNGPEIVLPEGSKMNKVATYQNGKGAIVAGPYGKGKVVIFSPHPEGMKFRGIKPSPHSLQLFKNAIQFCGVKENEN